jgi:hypothetical protein
VEHQRRVWIERSYPSPSYFEDFTLVVNVLLDDLSFANGACSRVGAVLLDTREAQLVDGVTAALRRVLSRLPARATDDVALSDASWPDVVARAEALRAFESDAASG